MCARYHSVLDAARLREFFRAIRDSGLDVLDRDVFPGRFAPIVRRPPELESGDEAVPEREAVVARFGLIPFWATDMRKVKLTYNARSETVATARPFQAAWKKAQHCIVPAEAIYEPDWRSNVHVPTRISAADGSPLAIAGLWNTWHSPAGERVHTFTLMTVNADSHPVMCNYHRPGEEKRMVVLLDASQYDAWLDAPAEGPMDFMQACPPERLAATGEPVERAPAKAVPQTASLFD